MLRILAITMLLATGLAFEFPPLPKFFTNPTIPLILQQKPSPSLVQKKKALLEAVSFTNNGKDASVETQEKVLRMVREIEKDAPPSQTILSNQEEAMALDGVWYLQYTSPSIVGDPDAIPDAWKPQVADEGELNIETKQFNAKGSISAGGIKVDTSNKVVKQIFDIGESRVVNDVNLDFGQVTLGGIFRPSPNVYNRAIISFREARITLNNGFVVDIGFLFSILAIVRGTKDNGWLETTYLGEDMRLGRGNKGTMFVLTRDIDAVNP